MNSKGKNFAQKSINFLLNGLIIIFGIILLISIYTGVQTKILGNAYTNFFGYSIFEVQTGSMADTINAGDCIIVKLTKNVKLKDIVTYKAGKEYITHRIIEVYNGTYITRGDANNDKDDKPVDQSQIVGKVVSIWSHFGILRKTLFNPSVLIALIITLFFFDLAFRKNRQGEDNKLINMILKKVNNNYKIKSLIEKITDNKIISTIKNKVKQLMEHSNTNDIFENNMLLNEHKPLTDCKHIYDNEELKDNKYSNEDSLEKTSIYRVISVDPNDVGDDYDKLVPKITAEEVKMAESHQNLDKTSIYRVISVDAPTDSKDKELAHKIKEEENQNTDYYKDNDLEKTSIYRVISVDANDVDDKYKEVVPKIKEEEIQNTEIPNEEDLDKTSFYRFVSVDAKEVNNTLLEIAQNEISGSEQNDKNKKKEEEIEPEEIIEDEEENNDLTQIDLELLDKLKNSLKGKNVIETVMNIKKEEMSEIADLLYDDDKIRFSKNNIKKVFINTCIDGKYYNYFDNTEINSKNITLKLQDAIKRTADTLITEYKGNDQKYKDVVNIYAKVFNLIISFEKAKDSITSSKVKQEFYKKELAKYSKDGLIQNIVHTANEIIKIQRNYEDMIDYYLAKLETNMFNLEFNKLTTKKDIYGLKLEHNITFSKIYSDYIIDKTYTEGIIAEDKLTVLLTLLLVQLCKDMMAGHYNRKYIFYMPNSLYTKERKLEKLLKMIDDRYAKDNIIILLTFADLLNYKKILKDIRKADYRFAIVFDKDSVIEEKDRGHIYIADYIFMNKKIVSTTKILQFIPEELISKIIYEDIIDKVGNVGGE